MPLAERPIPVIGTWGWHDVLEARTPDIQPHAVNKPPMDPIRGDSACPHRRKQWIGSISEGSKSPVAGGASAVAVARPWRAVSRR